MTLAGSALLPVIRAKGLRPLNRGARTAGEAFQIGRLDVITVPGQLVTEAQVDAVTVENANAFAQQVAGFTTTKTKNRRDDRRRDHLVTALGVVLWWGERRLTPVTPQSIPSAAAIDCRPPTFDAPLAGTAPGMDAEHRPLG